MYSIIRIFSLLSIVSLTLGSLTGCGEKRIHVATVSGTPGEAAAVSSVIDESAKTEVFGLSEASIDESALSAQDSVADELLVGAEAPAISNEPVNMAHAPSVRSSQDGSSDSFFPDTPIPSQISGFPEDDSAFAPLREGRDFAAQSSSSSETQANHSLANVKDFQESTETQYSDPKPSSLSQDSSAELEHTFLGEGVEPVLDVFQIAKAEPSDGLQDQLNRIQEEEFSKAANLEDVFFQFDSWVLTQEGQRSLERTLGWFNQDPSSNLIIEGHADQRGTQAYNMVLGEKRALAVQDYLLQLGIATSRLAIVSYGKDKPFCVDDTEVCHYLNRRGHLLIR